MIGEATGMTDNRRATEVFGVVNKKNDWEGKTKNRKRKQEK